MSDQPAIVTSAGLNAGEPTLSSAGLRVIDIVRLAYAEGLAAGDAMSAPPIGREGLEAAVNYCADRGCDRDGSHCTGCRLKSDEQGIVSLDEFCRRLAGIRFENSPVIIEGAGTGELTLQSLEALLKGWQGEEVFYLARRVHRRMHKERDPRHKKMAGPDGTEGPAIILVQPQMADNIGMVARAMTNFGLEAMRLVAPRDGWPNEKARAAASGANHVVDSAITYPDTSAAIGDLHWICATTARQRQMRKPVMTPEQAAGEMQLRIARGERVGVLFGPERQGLENDDVALADAIVMAPVNSNFASLNLAQAVLLLGYEWMKTTQRGTLGRVTTYEAPLETGLNRRGSPPATKEQLAGLFEHLERELDRTGFLKPPEKRAVMVRNIRTMFERMEATEQEVRTLRGIVASLTLTHRRRAEVP